MLTIYPEIYEQLSSLLLEAIGEKSFYSGEIHFEDQGCDYRFMATLMIYHFECQYPEGYDSLIENIVPVWWEFHTTLSEGEQINDFDFLLLKEVICD